ncbi:thiamine pyrophosphate-dependent enzyme [Bacteriovorax sp. PP10]|uniref:3-methyl-2-oxobutanoate dehydrogenase (2-methylpropanoyl-transferring) n=1 Tax=Bacteriovorax antarcticus TaxID=3088717 RepID=A0ABU5VZ68_9BACT|nr:thiamine pyrophosphate-dependent enzyme [Bacteriovorax sp. PP10]MEA9357887.1 thiamine pyrophosphate-dependent enzyme [Bacteriovorax sp. PP10]
MLKKVEKKYSAKKTPKAELKKWYELMTLGRLLDERAPNYLKQAVGWSYHAPYAGHDGIQLAIGQTFVRGEDHLFPYYRDMLTAVSAGVNAEEIILNGISKATDLASGGRHMSNHFAKPEWNIHNVSSCTGNHTLHAVGVARAMKRYKHKGVAISSQGESSVSEGYVYEAINGASVEKLPVVFVFQDNGYGISVPKRDQTANERVADNFTGFLNLTIIHCDGKDVFDSMSAMDEARKIAIEKSEPVIVHADCVRIGNHSNSDKHEWYRDDAEIAAAKAQDPYPRFRKELLDAKVFTEAELAAVDEAMKKEVLDAHTKAMKAPNPDPASIYDFLYAEAHVSTKYPQGTHNETSEPVKFIDSINGTLKAEFRHNPNTFIWGQDMANKEKGGIFNVSKGMQQEFGIDRVFNGPIAEDFILGTANGFSRFRDDIRVCVEGAEFADYFWPAMEQYIEMSHDYWRSNGAFSPNVVIRLASGGYIGGGLYHSQNLEGSLAAIPGIRIVVPAFADDAAGLLRTAFRSKGPTLFLEPKALYNSKSAMTPVPEDFEVPFGVARTRKEGKDLTVLTYGNTVHMCLEAANRLEAEGFNVEVIDLRSIVPLDVDSIVKSVKKTGRCLIVHEDKVFGGFGGELVGVVNEKAFEYLDAPVKRIGSTNTPVGFNRILEKAILPNTDRIYTGMLDLLKY